MGREPKFVPVDPSLSLFKRYVQVFCTGNTQVCCAGNTQVCCTGNTRVCGTCRRWIPDKDAPGAWLSWEPVKQVCAPGGGGQGRRRSSQETPPQGAPPNRLQTQD